MESNQKKGAALLLATVLAVPAEGLRQVAYRDPVGIMTVCYGETHNVDPTRKYTIQECKNRLNYSMLETIDHVDKCSPNLPIPVLAAFSDAAYNIGYTVACDTKKSTAARMLKSGDIKGACLQLLRWDKANIGGVMVSLPGLTKRRNEESKLCLTGLNSA